MSTKLNLVTGATGLLGSHVAERLVERGERVRALVRPSSETTFLRGLGVELATGDLEVPASLAPAVAGVETVYHCAARVGDWGPWHAFQRQIIDATGNLLEACRSAGVGRVLHVSSIIVYGHPRIGSEQVTEDEPLGQNLRLWDYYCRAKIRAEELCRQYPGPLTIVRPSWIFGPRDRTTLPRVMKALDAGRVGLIGDGSNLVNVIYVGDVADGVILAANHPAAIGQAYHLSSQGELTQRQFLDLLTDKLGRPRIDRRISFRLAYAAGFLSEAIGRLIRMRRPPHLTRYAVGVIGRSTRFSIEKARTQLGWRPQVSIADGLDAALRWWLSEHGASYPGERRAS